MTLGRALRPARPDSLAQVPRADASRSVIPTSRSPDSGRLGSEGAAAADGGGKGETAAREGKLRPHQASAEARAAHGEAAGGTERSAPLGITPSLPLWESRRLCGAFPQSSTFPTRDERRPTVVPITAGDGVMALGVGVGHGE